MVRKVSTANVVNTSNDEYSSISLYRQELIHNELCKLKESKICKRRDGDVDVGEKEERGWEEDGDILISEWLLCKK